jgi:adenylate cyclase
VTNLAARLSARAAAGQILVGPAIFAAVEERVDVVPAGDLRLKGFSRAVAVHDVVGLRTSTPG